MESKDVIQNDDIDQDEIITLLVKKFGKFLKNTRPQDWVKEENYSRKRGFYTKSELHMFRMRKARSHERGFPFSCKENWFQRKGKIEIKEGLHFLG